MKKFDIEKLKVNTEDKKITIEDLLENYTKEQLAQALLNSVNSEIDLLDNGCGNNLDQRYILLNHLKNKD